MTQRRMARLGLGRWAELDDASSISLSPVSLRALSVSLSLVSKSGNGLKVKYKSKMISRSKLNILRSTEKIFWKIYISCATKHPHLRKSISGSDLKPKQTQPKLQTSHYRKIQFKQHNSNKPTKTMQA